MGVLLGYHTLRLHLFGALNRLIARLFGRSEHLLKTLCLRKLRHSLLFTLRSPLLVLLKLCANVLDVIRPELITQLLLRVALESPFERPWWELNKISIRGDLIGLTNELPSGGSSRWLGRGNLGR